VAWPSAADPVLKFDLARTEVTGRPGLGTGQHTTTIKKRVENLNILNRVIATLDVDLIFTYTRNPTPAAPKQRDPVRVSIVANQLAVSIDGIPVPFTLNAGIPDAAGQDFKTFRLPGPGAGRIESFRPGLAHHKHEHGEAGPGGHNHGVIFTALAESTGAVPFIYADPDFGLVSRPNLDVYFAEWWGEPYRQSFTLLRVVLKNAQDSRSALGTFFTGEVVIDGDPNGREYP